MGVAADLRNHSRASARLVRHPAELLFGARLPLGPVALAGELGLGLDAQIRSTTSATQGFGKTPDDAVLTVAVLPRSASPSKPSDALRFSGSWASTTLRIRRLTSSIRRLGSGCSARRGCVPGSIWGSALSSFEKKFRPNERAPDSQVHGADDTVQPSAEPPLDGDRKLMRLVAEGDSLAQRTVVTRLMGRVKGVCHALIRDAADADDTAQVSLLQVLRAASTYRGDGALESWANRIAIRNAMRAVSARRKTLRGRRTRSSSTNCRARTRFRYHRGSPRLVEAYLRRLPESTRTVLTLRHQLGYSVREIAEAYRVSPNTVKNRLLRGREQLRKMVRRDRAIGGRAWDEKPTHHRATKLV